MTESDKVISIITCDVEGRIETFNENAEKLFDYTSEEIIGKKRVSLFSPGLVVLGHVANWLKKARAIKKDTLPEPHSSEKMGRNLQLNSPVLQQ